MLSQVDIFSFAIFLFELLTGSRPFHEYRNVVDIKKAIRRGVRPSFHLELDTQLPRLEGLMRQEFSRYTHCIHLTCRKVVRININSFVLRVVDHAGISCRRSDLLQAKFWSRWKNRPSYVSVDLYLPLMKTCWRKLQQFILYRMSGLVREWRVGWGEGIFLPFGIYFCTSSRSLVCLLVRSISCVSAFKETKICTRSNKQN